MPFGRFPGIVFFEMFTVLLFIRLVGFKISPQRFIQLSVILAFGLAIVHTTAEGFKV